MTSAIDIAEMQSNAWIYEGATSAHRHERTSGNPPVDSACLWARRPQQALPMQGITTAIARGWLRAGGCFVTCSARHRRQLTLATTVASSTPRLPGLTGSLPP